MKMILHMLMKLYFWVGNNGMHVCMGRNLKKNCQSKTFLLRDYFDEQFCRIILETTVVILTILTKKIYSSVGKNHGHVLSGRHIEKTSSKMFSTLRLLVKAQTVFLEFG